MRLSEFIQDMLYEIAEGVKGGTLKARDLVAIVPVTLNGENVGEKNYIEFDVSVVVSEAAEKQSGGDRRIGGKIDVASVFKVDASLGDTAKSSSSAKAEQTHRISFKVPIYWGANYRDNPATQAEAAEFEARKARTIRPD